MITGPDPSDERWADLASIADRLASLAETAELMGDEAGAARLREVATRAGLQAMRGRDG